MKKHLALVFFMLLTIFTVRSQAQTLNGHLDNVPLLLPATIYAYGIPDSLNNITSTQTDANGDFSFDFSNFNSNAYYAYCYFYDCTGTLVDSLFSLNTLTTYFYSDYCPNPTGGGSGGNCNVSFTTTYDSVTNTFSLYLDTTGVSNASYIYWSFGDGTYSTDWFPSHEYSTNGLFDVCIYIASFLNADSCWYCHVIGIDSAGNIVLKPSNVGFDMHVYPATTTSTGAIPDLKPIALYPNPAGQMTTLQFVSANSEPVEISIENTIGQQVNKINHATSVGFNQVPIDVSDLPAGIYILTVKSHSKQFSERLIK